MVENSRRNILPLSKFEASKAKLDARLKSDLFLEQESGTINQPLYHYTSIASLRGILTSTSFWFTDYRHLNDPTELVHGVSTAISVAKAIGMTRAGPVTEFLSLLIDLLRRQNFDSGLLQFFTCSFSSSRDDLKQWQAYGDNGRGIAIGLSPALFAIEDRIDIAPDERVFVGTVRYQPEAIKKRYAKALHHAVRVVDAAGKTVWFRGMVQAARNLFYRNIANELVASAWIWHSLTSKHDAYEHEKETRLVMIGSNGMLDPFIKTRMRGKEVVPYIPHRMPLKRNGSLAEIIIGPAAPEGAKQAVEDILAELGVEGKVAVNRSPIPYRVFVQ